MTGERTDPPTIDDEPLGTTDPTWRDEQPTDDGERTIDVDADLLEHVRAAARAARDGLAAPPTPAATDGEPDSAEPDPEPEPPTGTGVGPWSPPPAGGVTSSLLPQAEPGTLPPPSAAPRATVAVAPPTEPAPVAPPAKPAPVASTGAAATASAATAAGGGRWQPPARLRPAEVPSTAPLLADRPPRRRHLDWRWATLGIVLALAVGFLIAIAVSGDDAPDPAPGSTTVPGASTTVSTQ